MDKQNGLHIYIHLDELQTGSSVAGNYSNTNEKSSPSNADQSARGIMTATKKMVSYAAIKGTADNLISYEISQVELRTGAAEMEQRLSTVHSIASQSLDAGVALGVGIATGTWPIVIMGMVTKGINQIISYAQRKNTISTENALEDVSIRMRTLRAGVSGRRG